MTNQEINMVMGRLEDMTNQMVIHQKNGDLDLIALLNASADELAQTMDEGELMTLGAL